MFLDEVVLKVRSGAGGDGCSAFRREKYVPMGGPAGGDGGRGGNVILRADPQLTTFGDMPAERVIHAESGGRGQGSKCHGSNAEDVVIGVPPGTTVFDADSGVCLTDLVTPGAEWIAARGGKGGYGNARFASATDQAPTRFTKGGPAVERRLKLELRLLADVGLVGLPNAGKSTMLARVSRATPKIADYPFTTLEPYLGIVALPNFTRFVLADLPGLIEGAHAGKGLGDRFLRHVERTRVILHLVDLFPTDGSDPLANWRTIRGELEAYGQGLADRIEVVAGTKADIGGGDAAPVAASLAKAIGVPVLAVSAVTGAGMKALLIALAKALERARSAEGGAPAKRPALRVVGGGAPAKRPAARRRRKASPSPARRAPTPSATPKKGTKRAGRSPGKRAKKPPRGGPRAR